MASWKLTLSCTRAQAEAAQMDDEALAGFDPPPVLLAREEVEDDPDRWLLEAYFDGKPDKAVVAAVKALVPGGKASKAKPEEVPDEDWVTLSQSGIEPVRAGRFYVHTSTNCGDVPEGAKTFLIEASRAFGTGTHQTTAGCLTTLDALKRRGARFDNLLDLGTGTGLLAFAAMHLWPRAYATATDIDPVSIDVTAENADINGVPLGLTPGRLALTAAAGMDHPLIRTRARYDLIIANILAGPLIELAPSIAEALAPGGTLVLAGLLDTQADNVARAYRRHGLRLAGRLPMGDWPTLRLVKRVRHGADRVTRPGPRGVGEAPGYGSW